MACIAPRIPAARAPARPLCVHHRAGPGAQRRHVRATEIHQRLDTREGFEDWLWPALLRSGLTAGVDYQVTPNPSDITLTVYAALVVVMDVEHGPHGVQMFRDLSHALEHPPAAGAR